MAAGLAGQVLIAANFPAAPWSTAELKYAVLATAGEPFLCTGLPSRVDSPSSAYPHILADATTYTAIVRHRHLPLAGLTSDQIATVYVEDLRLAAVHLDRHGLTSDFDVAASVGDGLRRVTGQVDWLGHVSNVRRGDSYFASCPICLEADTPVATPNGDVPVSKLIAGMPIWSAATDGSRLLGTVMAAGSTVVPPRHLLVHLVLSDGRWVNASAPHTTADGRPLGSLRVGDIVDGSRVIEARSISNPFARTYDVLPSGPTGVYWARGIPLQSTLHRSGARTEDANTAV